LKHHDIALTAENVSLAVQEIDNISSLNVTSEEDVINDIIEASTESKALLPLKRDSGYVSDMKIEIVPTISFTYKNKVFEVPLSLANDSEVNICYNIAEKQFTEYEDVGESWLPFESACTITGLFDSNSSQYIDCGDVYTHIEL